MENLNGESIGKQEFLEKQLGNILGSMKRRDPNY